MPRKPGLLAAVAIAVTSSLLPTMQAGAAPSAQAPLSAASSSSVSSSSVLATTTAEEAPAAGRIAWRPCPKDDPVEGSRLRGLLCGTLRVPLDHRRPSGRKITIALTMAKHTDGRRYRGAVLLNRGGPGAHGRDLPARFQRARSGRWGKVAARYDWIGFDPRGVGAADPAIMCAEDYQDADRAEPDSVPGSWGDELAWRARAEAAAADCGQKYGDLLPHMTTENTARDLDKVREALGLSRIGYLGYSYGTYLGAVYADLFPDRTGRMVLDSVVRPGGVWYQSNLDQNAAFEKRIRAFFGWIAAQHATYRLGSTAAAVERAYYTARARLSDLPIDGKVGPVELDDAFLSDAYDDETWPEHAAALSEYLRHGDSSGLLKAWNPPNYLDRNNYAVYLAVQCRDAAWPRDWSVWHRDHWRHYDSGHRFETWNNAWYNAPCAYWPVPGGPAPLARGQRIGGAARPPAALLMQNEGDAATPYRGAVELHERLPASRLIVAGGGNHGVFMDGNVCADRYVWNYFGTGRLPASRKGPDARCPGTRPPSPTPLKAGSATG